MNKLFYPILWRIGIIVVGLIVSVLVGDESSIQFGYPSVLTMAGILGLFIGMGGFASLGCTVLL